MESREKIYDLLNSSLKTSTADETEIILSDYRLISIRFANNTITQNLDETGARVSVRSIVGKKQARFETNSFSADALNTAIKNATELARIMPEDKDLVNLPSNFSYQQVNSFDKELAAIEPDQCVNMVKNVIELAKKNGVQAAGTLEVSVGPNANWGFYPPSAICNSQGLFAYHINTDINFSVTCKKENGSGYASKGSHFLKDINVEEITKKSIDKGISSQNPKPLGPGRYKCLLEPLATSELVMWIASAFNALRYMEERTFLTGKLGKKIGGDNITLLDDPYNSNQLGTPFDMEGVPKKKLTLIDKGQVKELLHDSYTAKKMNTESNGRSYEMPNIWGPIPSNVVMEGGTLEPNDLLSKLDKGVLITRFWYSNYVDPRQGILTGMTRDGVFWVEDGKIKHPVTNFRFNCNLEEFLNNVAILSKPVLIDTNTFVPAVIVNNFNLESSTEF